MKTYLKTIDQLIENNEKCPLPLEVIPNNMGINLCSVAAIGWQETSTDELVILSTIYRSPLQNSIYRILAC